MATGDLYMRGDAMRRSYADYGLTGKRVKELLKECRTGKHGAQVRTAAYKACPLAAEHIIRSIVQKKSYDILEFDVKLGRVPYGKTDFYGYRRYTLAILNNMLAEKENA